MTKLVESVFQNEAQKEEQKKEERPYAYNLMKVTRGIGEDCEECVVATFAPGEDLAMRVSDFLSDQNYQHRLYPFGSDLIGVYPIFRLMRSDLL